MIWAVGERYARLGEFFIQLSGLLIGGVHSLWRSPLSYASPLYSLSTSLQARDPILQLRCSMRRRVRTYLDSATQN